MPINIPKAGLLVTAILVTAIATATTWTASVKPVMADRPSAPSGVAVSATDENTVDVIWSAHPDGAEDYRVAWKPDGENDRSRHNLEWNAYPTGANHSITGLEADTTCRVKVRARFQDGPASEWSSEATVTTSEAERVGRSTHIETPRSVTFTDIQTTSATINWAAPTDSSVSHVKIEWVFR